MLLPTLILLGAAAIQGPTLAIQGSQFTFDGEPTFLLGISYYGALAIEEEAIADDDLAQMQACGFNWVRVWATWSAYENNVCAVNRVGAPHGPYLDRLLRLCRLAGARGMAVDVTLHRGKDADVPRTIEEHLAVAKALATALLPYRNVYFDVGNERNVGDARFVPLEEVAQLIAAVKAIDPDRICTASDGGDIGDDGARKLLKKGHVDFLAPHRGRYAGSAAETAERTRALLAAAVAVRPVPVHFQEPFRRGYANWNPTASDFQTDLEQARNAGAAGWCFHNGGTRTVDNERPRRSFDLRAEEPRLFAQFDGEERAFLDWLRAQTGAPSPD